MMSLLPPLAATILMGGVPFAFNADASLNARYMAPYMTYTAQSAPAQPAAELVKAEPKVQAPVSFENDAPAVIEVAQVETAAQPATQPAANGALSATDRQVILDKAAEALAAAKTAKGRFTQVAPDGSLTRGDFALRRPGRMRFDYDDPTPILIVSDGATVAMEDSELETVDRVPLASTPLGMILAEKLDFETKARVVDVDRGNNRVSITVEDRSGEAEGQLTMYFDSTTYQLMSWQTLDANRQTTLVTLEDVKTNGSVDPRLFILDDPADEEEDER